MSAFLTDLLLLFLLTVLNGVFAMSEIALVSSRKVRLQSLSDEGSAGAKRALDFERCRRRKGDFVMYMLGRMPVATDRFEAG